MGFLQYILLYCLQRDQLLVESCCVNFIFVDINMPAESNNQQFFDFVSRVGRNALVGAAIGGVSAIATKAADGIPTRTMPIDELAYSGAVAGAIVGASFLHSLNFKAYYRSSETVTSTFGSDSRNLNFECSLPFGRAAAPAVAGILSKAIFKKEFQDTSYKKTIGSAYAGFGLFAVAALVAMCCAKGRSSQQAETEPEIEVVSPNRRGIESGNETAQQPTATDVQNEDSFVSMRSQARLPAI